MKELIPRRRGISAGPFSREEGLPLGRSDSARVQPCNVIGSDPGSRGCEDARVSSGGSRLRGR
jgi:hypothetical protein